MNIKKAKGTKKCVIKRKLKLQDYKNCLEVAQIEKKNTKMFNFNYITKEDIKEHNPKWSEIPDHPYRILIIGGSVSGKTNALLNLINNEPDIVKIYLYNKDPYEAKYQLLINKTESTKFLSNTRMIWMIFTKILKNTI